jgi:hypothetical protein
MHTQQFRNAILQSTFWPEDFVCLPGRFPGMGRVRKNGLLHTPKDSFSSDYTKSPICPGPRRVWRGLKLHRDRVRITVNAVSGFCTLHVLNAHSLMRCNRPFEEDLSRGHQSRPDRSRINA